MELSSAIQNKYHVTGQGAEEKFQAEIIAGLTGNPKRLPSKYFYDSFGDKLFQRIMDMPEYYLTRCELDIFRSKTAELAAAISTHGEPFDLIELGAGDATKSSYLLQYLIDSNADFSYMPIDISKNILTVLDNKLKIAMPLLKIICLEGEYFDMLEEAQRLSKRKKVVLFLGSNIGNMELSEAHRFCKQLNKKLAKGDIVLIGFDLKKNPHTILEAYNDKAGITAAFNLNLLSRINRELGADFDLKQFQHYQTYDPVSGACRSFLISLHNQVVQIDGQTLSFYRDELIHMEVSQKFSSSEIKQLAQDTGFKSIHEITDDKHWFLDAVWQVI
ncbi:L-histidine N(alpha)-methyltransferase [Sphingobacterium faecium]|uniref:L-histidine N(alpha)-methyltransferase n=1 Tax=Sphingobacterium faecium TaxID=34087 RepID=UPI00320A8E83